MASAIRTTTKGNWLVKITFFIKKKDGLSDEEFHKHWSENHAEIFLSVPIARQNIVKYSQFHSDSSVNLAPYGIGMAGFDGGANMWAYSLEDVFAVFKDEEYLRVVRPDEEQFLNSAETVAMLGWEEDKWEKSS
ncbi:hypothetical protein Hte_002286 [Hypoxylon texense]